jgi:ATP-dependent exoDNAse (exonuclease V) alpha subunit
LSDILVNGLQGTIQDISAEGPTVHFAKVDIRVKLERQLFSVYGKGNAVLGQRRQFPLALSYAMTAHKAQGMSLPSVIVDCRTMKQAGQVGVAVGRAMTTEGLQVVNFRRSDVQTPTHNVLAFIASPFAKAICENYSCCRKVNILYTT